MGAEIPTTLPGQDEVQARYNAAKDAGLSPCAWCPPEWPKIRIVGGKALLPDNSGDQKGFENPLATEESKERIVDGKRMNKPGNPETPSATDSWSNAFSDFTHVDESEYPNAAIATLQAPMLAEVKAISAPLAETLSIALKGPNQSLKQELIKALKDKLANDPLQFLALKKRIKQALKEADGNVAELESKLTTVLGTSPLLLQAVAAIKSSPPPSPQLITRVATELAGHADLINRVNDAIEGKDPVGRLKKIVGPNSPGMKRLGLIFEWALYRTTELMGDINNALNDKTKAEELYKEARQNYIKFLRDLDDHEPGKTRSELDVMDKKKPSGYGRSLKWACIDPVIFEGRIVGARVIIHWNPHSSSNGIPIAHP